MLKLDYLAQTFKNIHPSWQQFLNDTFSAQLSIIDNKLSLISQSKRIFPPAQDTLRALELAINECKVIILGQDPYHGENEANGLAFAVNNGIKTPPSLRNIFKELVLEFNPLLTDLTSSLLEEWSQQGVLLLNTSLSVIKDQPNSLAKIGWHEITDGIIQHISATNTNCVFILWGNYARNKKTLIDTQKHLVLESAHPSPFSANRGFFGCNHFQSANDYLLTNNKSPITWL